MEFYELNFFKIKKKTSLRYYNYNLPIYNITSRVELGWV